MKKIFKPLFAICLIACLFLANNGWCAASREDWKEQLIEKGRQQLLDTQLRNIQNDVRGESHLNSYVVLVSSSANAYPNSDYIQQKKGKRGSEEIGDYMLTQDQLTRLNELLASYNSKNDISTYLLLVDHMPLDFIDVIPDEQTITDIINSKKSEENFTKYVTEQALEDARDIVESITAPLLEQLKSPTLYCGLVNFKVYKNEKEGKGFTIYYPRNSAINFDSQYRHMLASFVSQQKSRQWTNNYEKVSGIIEAIRLNNEEYGKIKGLFTDLTNIVDPKILFQKISSLSANGLSSFDVDQRLHILKVLSSDGLNDDEETLALNIFKASPAKDAGEFLKGLKESNEFHGDKDALLNCLLGSTQDAIMGFWGEDNFKSLSNELVRLWSASVSLSSQYEAIVSSIPDDRIFYRGESSETRNGVNYRESSYLPSSIASNGQLSFKGFYKLELKGKVLADDAVQITETLDPFETIGLVFLSPPANDILGSVGTGKVIPLPAIAYHCYDTKAWTNAEQKTAIDIVQLASVAVAIGEIQSARQAWRVVKGVDELFQLTNFKNIKAVTPTGKHLTNLRKIEFVENGYKIKPTSGSLKNKVDDIIANGDNLGAKTESIVDDIMSQNGYKKLDGKYGGNNGYDGVYVKGSIENPSEIIIVESKQFKYTNGVADEIVEHAGVTLSPPSGTTQLPAQMSDDWINYVAGNLTKNSNTKVLGDKIQELLLIDPDKIIKYVAAVDKSKAEINFLKLAKY